MSNNPVDVPIPRDQGGIVSCVSHAAYYQKVTLQWPGGGQTVVFEGTGEGVQMKTPDGATSVPVGPDRSPLSLSCLFQYSTSGSSGPLNLAKVKPPEIVSGDGHTTITVVSEDDVDDDYNDSYLTFSLSS